VVETIPPLASKVIVDLLGGSVATNTIEINITAQIATMPIFLPNCRLLIIV